MDVSEVCARARDLILREGFTKGGAGWLGDGGWCIEGALGQALGLDRFDHHLSYKVNTSPAGQAILDHLHLPSGWSLHVWNDRGPTKEGVLQVLAEVAAKYSDPDYMAKVPVRYFHPTVGLAMDTISYEFTINNEVEPVQQKVWFKSLLGV